MSSGNSKELRKQLRNVVQEILPELLRVEMMQGIAVDLRKDMMGRLNAIEDMVKQNLENLKERQMDVQNYIINQLQAEIISKSNAPDAGIVAGEVQKTEETQLSFEFK